MHLGILANELFIREVALLSDDARSWRAQRHNDRGKSYDGCRFFQNKKGDAGKSHQVVLDNSNPTRPLRS